MTYRVIEGDCLEQMAAMPAASVDAVVCDPPYGLEFMGKEWDRLGAVTEAVTDTANRDGNWTSKPFDGGGQRVRYGTTAKSMQEWHEAWATEALRVLKPGGHLLAFGGTRTYHRLACAIEDAGFEIRDTIAWLYGSGFPKSLDVSKAIDKADDSRRPEREAVGRWLREQREAAGLKQKEVAAHWPSATGGLTGCVANWEGGFNCPTLDQWADLKHIICLPDDMDAEVWRLNGRKGAPGKNWEKREKIGNGQGAGSRGNTFPLAPEYDLTAPATPEAQQWNGWGTALKPAHEPVVVARKPLTGTVAANVLEHGTGALNVDGCRVEAVTVKGAGLDVNTHLRPSVRRTSDENSSSYSIHKTEDAYTVPPSGRWPANVLLDPEAAELLDAQTGPLHSQDPATRNGGRKPEWSPSGTTRKVIEKSNPNGGDKGGASRFFYVAKASRAERNAGLDGFEERLPDNAIDRASQRNGEEAAAGRGSLTKPMANVHPTVKPIALMRWLVRLVTPPGGVVLDPFTGSGTTGIAVVLEGFDFIGIEREPEYVAIARARIAHWAAQPVQLGLEAA